jgi:hypothetical protein
MEEADQAVMAGMAGLRPEIVKGDLHGVHLADSVL